MDESFDINKPIPGFNYLLGQVGWFSEHIPVDNEFDHHTEVEYVVKRDGITPVFLSAIPVLIMRC